VHGNGITAQRFTWGSLGCPAGLSPAMLLTASIDERKRGKLRSAWTAEGVFGAAVPTWDLAPFLPIPELRCR
jgi:hypothetical protein